MKNEPWVVKTSAGDIWGKICRVVIDSSSRQVVCVGVMLCDTNQCVRVPWKNLEIKGQDIVLNTSEGDIHMAMLPWEGKAQDTVTLEESASACHV